MAHPVTLEALGIGKRRLGLTLAAIVFVGFFLLPMAAHLFPAFGKWQADRLMSLTGLLSPGGMSAGHGIFGNQCPTCHRQPFRPVADAVCTECHKLVPSHLSRDVSHAGKAGQAVQSHCIDCHAGHRSKNAGAGHDSAQCLACHENLGGGISRVRDFGERHPEFRLVAPPEESRLKFSHKVHLVKDGVSTPLGNTVLTCRDCHRLEESGIHFAPMKMGETCQQSSCHRQRFAEPLMGTIPHGSVREVMDRVRSLQLDRLTRNPAAAAHDYAAAKLFQEGGKAGVAPQCALCHDIEATGDGAVPWKIAPVRIRRDWQAKAEFSHVRHGTVDCTGCHDKANSASSSDLSIPGIAKCRECHAGNRGGVQKVESRCESCHRFHRFAPAPSA